MKAITVFDTGISTSNIGDEIIMDAVMRELKDMFADDFFAHVCTHNRLSAAGLRHAQKADLSFVGGTNLLFPHWFTSSGWKIDARDFWRVGHPVLLGVGWGKYKRSTDIFTAWMLQYLLKNKFYHSVRDGYTKQRLAQAGVKNVLNTGCPTMWRLTPDHCAAIPTQNARSAIVTLTYYSNELEQDRKWLEFVCSQYETVYFWPQMYEDAAYMDALGMKEKVVTIGANLMSYDKLLHNTAVDFIGTRLHGGVRALQHKRRALILEIDNRATEIAKDTDLPTAPRGDLEKIKKMIQQPQAVSLRLPFDTIKQWKAQF